MNLPHGLQFQCPVDRRTRLTSTHGELGCPTCGQVWRPADGFYPMLVEAALSPELRGTLELHTRSVPRITLSGWHHRLSDLRSHLTNGFIHRRLRREAPAAGQLIDLGCGNGFFRGLLPQSLTYVGVDFDPELLRRAAHYRPAVYVQAPVEAAPFEAEQFDAVASTETLEHLPDPEQMLREARRLLRPGGRVLLSAPNEYCWKYRVKGRHAQHAVNFDARSFRALVEKYFAVDVLELRGFWFPFSLGRQSLQVGWRMPEALATNFIVIGHKA